MIILPSISSTYGMTLGEMILDVSDAIRNTTINDRITSWINQEIISLAGYYLYPNLHSEAVLTTAGNQRSYSLPSDFHFLEVMVNPETSRPLNPITNQGLAYRDPLYSTRVGTVTHYALNGLSIDFYMIPASTILLPFHYQRRPLKLVSTTDVCDLPPEWHPLLILAATKKGIRREERGTDEYTQIVNEYELLKKRLEVGLKRRPDVITILQDPLMSGNRLPRPMLDPAHYRNE